MNKKPGAFWTISEVADDLDLPQHVLRFWETRFPHINPLKSAGGRRYYRPQDVDLIRGIRTLLYDEGYTIKGVLRILKEKGVQAVQDYNLNADNDASDLDFESETSTSDDVIDDAEYYNENDQQDFSLSPQSLSSRVREPVAFQNYDDIKFFTEDIPPKPRDFSKSSLGSTGQNLTSSSKSNAMDHSIEANPLPLEQNKLPRDRLSSVQIKKLMFVREELLECRRLLRTRNTIIDQTSEEE